MPALAMGAFVFPLVMLIMAFVALKCFIGMFVGTNDSN